MPISSRWKFFYRSLGLPEKIAFLIAAVYLILRLAAPGASYVLLAEILLIAAAAIVAVRLARAGIRKATWRLRNRLLVTYLFIAAVPMLLVVAMAAASGYLLIGQVAVYMVTAEIERRTAMLMRPARGLISGPRQLRSERIRGLAPFLQQNFPGLEVVVKNGGEWRYPETAQISFPPNGCANVGGVVLKNGGLYLWACAGEGDSGALLMAPVTRAFLDGLAPELGEVNLYNPLDLEQPAGTTRYVHRPLAETAGQARIPPRANRFDIQVSWFTIVPVADWDAPARTRNGALNVTTRTSAVFRALFSKRLNIAEGVWWDVFLLTGFLFLLAEAVSLVIGVSMTRTITRTVHNLYQGTQRVMQGDFSHRIDAVGGDQLAELGRSFNLMTENVERLVRVEKERERLQSELEIAREVQNQLYPKAVPSLRRLEMMALCNPARTVSGDYYDYLNLQGSKVALAIGDVAGKGISAALLMATVQASLRTQIQAWLEKAPDEAVPTAWLVSRLNRQLYAYTSPEKFATFYFGIYDDDTGLLTYTNAGHPPPVLLRNGEARRLETNGLVVGAFPSSEYGESRIELVSGDLLVCFTDGITELENEYGKMFGEDGLIDVLVKNAWRKPADIAAAVMASVEQWTNAAERQDDMTLLVAKRV